LIATSSFPERQVREDEKGKGQPHLKEVDW
jgi:hypothetical protein